MDFENVNQVREASIPVSQASEDVRAEFIRKTYLHVALAVLGFIAVEAAFLNTPFIVQIGLKLTQGWLWLIMLGGFMFVTNLATKWAENSADRSQQYAGLGLYIVAQAFIFVPLLYIAIYFIGDPTIIKKAGFITLFLFSGLTAIAFSTKRDFSFLGRFIMIGGMIALGLIAAGILFGFDLGLVFSAGMVLLAGASILYQTSNIIHHYNSEQYVAASLGLFASLMLLFWYVLSILMRMSGD